MKPIKIIEKNAPHITSALEIVHARAREHTYTAGAIINIAKLAELKLGVLGIPKNARRGAVVMGSSGAKLPNSYKYSRVISRMTIERRAGDWWLVDLSQYESWGEAGDWFLSVTPEQDAIAIRKFREEYCVKGVAQPADVMKELIEAAGAALVIVRGVAEYHAEEKLLNRALWNAGVSYWCNAEIPAP